MLDPDVKRIAAMDRCAGRCGPLTHHASPSRHELHLHGGWRFSAGFNRKPSLEGSCQDKGSRKPKAPGMQPDRHEEAARFALNSHGHRGIRFTNIGSALHGEVAVRANTEQTANLLL